MTLRRDLKTIAEIVPAGARVLDLGCGDGELLDYLVRKKQVRGSGIELSEEGVLDCVRRGLSVRQGNLEEGLADYPDGLLDVVILSQTLPYLNKPGHIVDEMLRVGRRAIVSFPNWGYWRCRWQFMTTGRVPNPPDFPQQWDGVRRWQWFTVSDFEALCRQRGVQIETKLFLDGRGPVGWGQRWRARTAVYTLLASD